ncbi:MAG: two-component regulator propeller domain-containing protein [Bacteroidota bacterium]
MRTTTLLAFSLLFLLANEASGQISKIGSPAIVNFSRTDYQAGTQNWMIQQDERGILYFANNKGLLEFDGTNWQTYPLPNGTIVRSVAIASNGRLYIGGQDEMGYLEAGTKQAYTYTSLVDLIPDTLQSFDDIWKIFIQANSIFFCSERAIFQLSDEKLQIIRPKGQRFENFFELDGNILVQELGQGLFRLQGQTLIPIPNSAVFSDERISAILPHPVHQSLIFTFSKGLYLMSGERIRPWEVAINDYLRTHLAYCVIQLENRSYAIGTARNGLVVMDQAGNPIRQLNKNFGLQNNTVLCIKQDIQKNLWLGLDNGIDYAEINSPFSKIQAEEGIMGTGYVSIVQTKP